MESLGAERMRLLLFPNERRRRSDGGSAGVGGSGESEIVTMSPRSALLEWLDELKRAAWRCREEKEEEERGGADARSDDKKGNDIEDLPDKRDLRGALVAIARYRHVASPSRYTMRKLSRFFTERK